VILAALSMVTTTNQEYLMHPLKKTVLLVSACLFVFGSAQAQEATDDNQATNEARQAERDTRQAKRDKMSDEDRQAMRQRRENMSDEERAAMKKRRQEGNAARHSQRQRPVGKGRPKRDQAE
jgi:hypothetical protein